MSKGKNVAMSPDIAEALEQFKKWRRTRKSRKPIPEDLWQSAIKLSKIHSVNKISKELSLNHTALKKRVYDSEIISSSFIEIDIPSPPLQISVSECVVEMVDVNGAQMKMYFKGEAGIDLLELGKAFWEKKR